MRQVCVLLLRKSRTWRLYTFVANDIDSRGTSALRIYTNLFIPVVPLHVLNALFLLRPCTPSRTVVVIVRNARTFSVEVLQAPAYHSVDAHGWRLWVKSSLRR